MPNGYMTIGQGYANFGRSISEGMQQRQQNALQQQEIQRQEAIRQQEIARQDAYRKEQEVASLQMGLAKAINDGDSTLVNLITSRGKGLDGKIFNDDFINSSKEMYAAARNFYLRNHYSIIAEINDFYAVGDNLMVFGKYFSK